MTLKKSREAILDDAWQKLLDKDDRTSPEEYPDMVLVTREDVAKLIETYKENMIAATRDVLLERERQVYVKGFHLCDDDKYESFELGKAAAAYLGHAIIKAATRKQKNYAPGIWPWASSWWKPTDRRRDLVKAAALAIAEIERLDRAAAQ